VTRRRILPLVALTAFALHATPAGASKTPRVTVRLPSPGHMTVAALAVDATASDPNALSRRVSLGAPRLGKLPPSVKVLFATRSIRIRGGRRYAAAIFVVRKATPSMAPVAYAADTDHEPNLVDMIFKGGGSGWSLCRNCHTERPRLEFEGDICDTCRDIRATWQLMAVQDADRRKARKLSALSDLFKRDFTQDGDPGPVFGGDGQSPDPTLDTGHYDDGHSFGWGTGRRLALPPPDVIRVEIDLVGDLMQRQPGQLMPDLEVATAVDLDGDGTIGPSRGPQQQIGTTVGPIVIT
jgi:hypothetical protein